MITSCVGSRTFFGMKVVKIFSRSSSGGLLFYKLEDQSGNIWWTTKNDICLYKSRTEHYYIDRDHGFDKARFNGVTIEHELDMKYFQLFDPIGASALRIIEEKYGTIFELYGDRENPMQGWSIKFPSPTTSHVDCRDGRIVFKNIDSSVSADIAKEWKQKCVELGGGGNLDRYKFNK